MTKKTTIQFEDRDRLLVYLRPIADGAGDRDNLTRLAAEAVDTIEAHVDSANDPELTEWLVRTQRHAFADRCYTEIDILLKAKQIRVLMPFAKKPIALSPRQGVRLPGMKEFQQVRFLSFTWDEYEVWRLDQLGRFDRAREIREIISLIDKVRLVNPDIASVGEALRKGGARIEVVIDIEDVA